MSRKKINVATMTSELGKCFTDYSDEMVAATRNAVDTAMRQMVRETKKRQNRTTRKAKEGEKTYKQSIASKVLKKTGFDYCKVWYVRQPNTGLAHLLNNGHRNHYNGNFVRGDKHITIAAKNASETMERMIKEAAQNA